MRSSYSGRQTIQFSFPHFHEHYLSLYNKNLDDDRLMISDADNFGILNIIRENTVDLQNIVGVKITTSEKLS